MEVRVTVWDLSCGVVRVVINQEMGRGIPVKN